MEIENQPTTKNPDNKDKIETTESTEQPDTPDVSTQELEADISNIENFIDQINNKIDGIADQNEQQLLREKIIKLERLLREKTQLDVSAIQQDLNEVYTLIGKYSNKITTPEKNESIKNRKDLLLSPNITFDTIQKLNDEMNDKDKILLLKDLSESGLQTNDILILASCMGFECGVLSVPVNDGNVNLPYINCPEPLGTVVIINGEVFSGIDENMVYMSYINSNKTKSGFTASLSYTEKLSATPYINDNGRFGFNQHELTNKMGYVIKTPFGLKINPYLKTKASGNISDTKIKSGLGTNISYSGSLGGGTNFSVYGGIYENLLKTSGGQFERELSTKIALGWDLQLQDNRSIGGEVEFSSGITEYKLNVEKRLGDMTSITGNFSYKTGGNNASPTGMLGVRLTF